MTIIPDVLGQFSSSMIIPIIPSQRTKGVLAAGEFVGDSLQTIPAAFFAQGRPSGIGANNSGYTPSESADFLANSTRFGRFTISGIEMPRFTLAAAQHFTDQNYWSFKPAQAFTTNFRARERFALATAVEFLGEKKG